MYEVPNIGPVVEIREFGNSHGSAPRIWSTLCARYFAEEFRWLLRPETLAELQRLNLTWFERVALLSTMDRVIVPFRHLIFCANAFEQFDRLYPCPGRVNHLPEFAKILRELAASGRQDLLGVCWHQSSTSEDPWQVSSEDDYRPFDWSIDADPKLLLDELDGIVEAK